MTYIRTTADAPAAVGWSRRTLPIHNVSTLLRHSDIRVTDKVYAHLAPENVRNTIQTLEGRTAQSGHIGEQEKVTVNA